MYTLNSVNSRMSRSYEYERDCRKQFIKNTARSDDVTNSIMQYYRTRVHFGKWFLLNVKISTCWVVTRLRLSIAVSLSATAYDSHKQFF